MEPTQPDNNTTNHTPPEANVPESPQTITPQQPTPQPMPQTTATGYPSATKSKTGLIIGLVVGGIVLLLVIMGVILALALGNKSNNKTDTSATDHTQHSEHNNKSTKTAFTATSSSHLGKVCDGTPIANAAKFTDKSSAKIMGFFKSPARYSGSWLSQTVGYGKSYYVKNLSTDYAQISVVGCLKPISDQNTPSIPCEMSGNTTIQYHSAKYELTYYEAQTAKKISSSTVDSPATSCPRFTTYDRETKKAFADPDRDTLEAEFDTFIRQPPSRINLVTTNSVVTFLLRELNP